MSGANEDIELLYTRDCKNWQETLSNLEQALKNLSIDEMPKVIPIDTWEQALEYHFFASPTIHINGTDIDKRSRRTGKRGLGIDRPYFYKSRSLSVPPVELIEEALKELY